MKLAAATPLPPPTRGGFFFVPKQALYLAFSPCHHLGGCSSIGPSRWDDVVLRGRALRCWAGRCGGECTQLSWRWHKSAGRACCLKSNNLTCTKASCQVPGLLLHQVVQHTCLPYNNPISAIQPFDDSLQYMLLGVWCISH